MENKKTISIIFTSVLSILSLVLSYVSRDASNFPTLILFYVGIFLAIIVAIGIFSRSK